MLHRHFGRRRLATAVVMLGATFVDAALAAAQIKMPPLVAAPAPRLPVLHGRLVDVDSTPIAGASVIVDWGSVVDTLHSDSTGWFAMMVRHVDADSVPITIVPDMAHHAARLHVAREQLREDIDVILLPRRWVIRGGAFAGDTVEISPAAVLSRIGRESFGRIAAPLAAPQRELVSWPRDRLPIPLSIHREPVRAVSAADSIALWRTVHAFEAELGITVFRPADDSTVQAEGWGAIVRADRALVPSGQTFTTWQEGGRIYDATITVRQPSDFADHSVMFHELLHALGFGHTGAWSSIMAKYAAAGRTELTHEDVAYAQLLLRLGALQRVVDTRFALREAAEGEAGERVGK